MSVKIVLSSDCNGRYDLLFPKVKSITAKAEFALMLMCGNCLSVQSSQFIHQLRKASPDQIQLPALPIYFIDSGPIGKLLQSIHPNGIQIAPKLSFLGSFGIKKIHQLTICFLNDSNDLLSFSNLLALYETLGNPNIDVLITNSWPSAYRNLPNLDVPKTESTIYNENITQLVRIVSPHYHLSCSGRMFFRMAPLKNQKGFPMHFINVGEIKENLQGRYLVAISVGTEGENPSLPSFDSLLINESVAPIVIPNQLDITSETSIRFQGFHPKAHKDEIRQFLERWGEISDIQMDRGQHKHGHAGSGAVKFTRLDATQSCLKDSGKYSTPFSEGRIKFSIKQSQCWFCSASPAFQPNLILLKPQLFSFFYLSQDQNPLSDLHFQIVAQEHWNGPDEWPSEATEQLHQLQNRIEKIMHDLTNSTSTLICCWRILNLSSEISHWFQHVLIIPEKESGVKSTLFSLNLLEKAGLYEISPSERRKRSKFRMELKIGSSLFCKDLTPKERRDPARQLLCQFLTSKKATFPLSSIIERISH